MLPCMEKGEGGKVGPAVMAACELPQSARGGVRARVRCGGSGGGVGARAIVEQRARASEARERGEGQRVLLML